MFVHPVVARFFACFAARRRARSGHVQLSLAVPTQRTRSLPRRPEIDGFEIELFTGDHSYLPGMVY